MADQDPADKIDKSNKRYQDSEKGRTAQKKYQDSVKGKKAGRKYLDSEKGKAAQLRYRLSEKGQGTTQRRNVTGKLMNQCREWMEKNPGKTIEDFMALLKEKEQEEES
ncbi:hypothetical protein LCGC14_1375810 [marine sediment metagenome]|uniref:Uncharacterized protein n=1 Tax=marine sediment metagenome TaxID=412755 RepID=A0A0F9N635_9ZZZZ